MKLNDAYSFSKKEKKKEMNSPVNMCIKVPKIQSSKKKMKCLNTSNIASNNIVAVHINLLLHYNVTIKINFLLRHYTFTVKINDDRSLPDVTPFKFLVQSDL